MLKISSVWQDNTPESLKDLVIKYCLKNPDVLKLHFNADNEMYVPREIGDRILYLCSLSKPTKIELLRILSLFQDPRKTPLSSVYLQDTSVDDEGLEYLCKHNLTDLNVSKCDFLTKSSYMPLLQAGKTLRSLDLGEAKKIILYAKEERFIEEFLNGDILMDNFHKEYVLDFPNLRSFVMQNVPFPRKLNFFEAGFERMKFLTHLDLSECSNMDSLNCIANHKCLQSLILFNVKEILGCIPNICTLKELRHLDISQSKEEQRVYQNPTQILTLIITSLENLVSLDISGTNLAGPSTQSSDEVAYSSSGKLLLTDIPGLQSRVDRPLEFLGLYNEAHNACNRHHIPAKKITGDHNEEQVLMACQAYCNRPEIAQRTLSDLFQIFRHSTCRNMKMALTVVIECMKRNMDFKYVPITGSASLFYIVKSDEKLNFTLKVKQTIINIVLEAMYTHLSEITMLRNGCLTLIHFKIPDDVLFVYESLVTFLLIVASQVDQEEFVQRVSVYLLNSLACQVDRDQKKMVGDLGAIAIMLRLIGDRLSQNICDEVMESAWGTMWNVTDEMPLNCQRFLNENGMTMFLSCLKTFPDKADLLRNMMGLLGNIAEVKDLRPYLMKDEYLTVFSDLLDSQSDGIEVSYNAAGILSHIASDGAEVWEKCNITVFPRDEVLQRMTSAIQKWSLDTKRNINYRSFEPILRLLFVRHTYEAQLWAMWALANLTKVYPEKYCSLLKTEGGLEIVKWFTKSQRSHIRFLADKIVEQCEKYDLNKDAENSL